jgi:hypothetical protein
MKRLFILSALLLTLFAQAQLTINLQLPPSGVVQKNQLWNMLVTNTSASAVTVHLELLMSDQQGGQPIMSAVSAPVTFLPGNTQLNAAQLTPIQYNSLSSSYNIDPGPNGFLPVGSFTVCFSFIQQVQDGISTINQECDVIEVEPLSPPQLVLPYDQTSLESPLPQFTWLPPMPASFFNNLLFDLDIVLVDTTIQTPADAIQQNIPVYHQSDIATTSLLYPASAPTLQYNILYAWRITAKSNGSIVSRSETWSFNLKQFVKVDSLGKSQLPYAQLMKDDQSGYAICMGDIKFAYTNELSDSNWNVSVNDVSSQNNKQTSFVLDSVKMKAGENLVKVDLRNNADFIDQHLYLLQLTNSRGEIWRLKFEFLKPDE